MFVVVVIAIVVALVPVVVVYVRNERWIKKGEILEFSEPCAFSFSGSSSAARCFRAETLAPFGRWTDIVSVRLYGKSWSSVFWVGGV